MFEKIIIIIALIYAIGRVFLDVLAEVDIKKGMSVDEAKLKYNFSRKGRKAKKILKSIKEKELEEYEKEITNNSDMSQMF